MKRCRDFSQNSFLYPLANVLLILALLLLVSACDNNGTTQPDGTSTQPTDNPTSSSTSSITVTPRPYEYDNTLTLSKAPKIGETAELTFMVDVIKLDESHPEEGLAKSRAWIDFYWTNTKGSFSEAYGSVQIPIEEVSVNDELSWEGSYDDALTLHGEIKLPREGIWSIIGRFYGEGWSTGFGAEIEVAVADGTAAIMGTEDFENGPLAYLSANSYAGGVRGPIVFPDPVSLGLDISKAPRPGEEVTLSCRIISIIDVPDFSIRWSFYRRLGDDIQKIPETELLSAEDLSWKTDVKKDVPVVFTTVIKLPTEGDWDIAAVGKSGINYLTGSGHRLKISITSTRSYFGWMEIPRPTSPTIPGTGTTTIAILP